MPDILTYLKDQGIPTDDLYASLTDIGVDDLDRWQMALEIESQSDGKVTMDCINFEAWDTLADVLETAGKLVTA